MTKEGKSEFTENIAKIKEQLMKGVLSPSELSDIKKDFWKLRQDINIKDANNFDLNRNLNEIQYIIKDTEKYHFQTNTYDTKDLLNLMEIYLSEWCHRDEFLWLQVFRYFYVTILVIFLPYIADYLKIDLPPFIDITFFPVAGIILSLVFLYLSLGYTKRLEAVSKTYQTVINCLPVFLQRKKVSELKHGKIFNHRLAGCLCFVIFVFTLLLSIFMLINLIRTTKTDLNFYLQPLKQIIN